jgi:hypothetical protein
LTKKQNKALVYILSETKTNTAVPQVAIVAPKRGTQELELLSHVAPDFN